MAKTALNFHAGTKQAEVLDSVSKYLINCCNRQMGKTTAIESRPMRDKDKLDYWMK